MPKIKPMINPNKIIDDLGGTSEVAKLCDCKPSSVSEWRVTGIPKARILYLKAIRPDVFATQIETNTSGQVTA